MWTLSKFCGNVTVLILSVVSMILVVAAVAFVGHFLFDVFTKWNH